MKLAAGTLWAAIVLRIERNQAALLTEIFPPHAPARTRTHTHTHTHDGTRDGWLRSGEVDNFHPALARVQVPSDKGVRNSLHVKVGSKIDHDHAAGAAAKGTFSTSRRLGGVKSCEVDLETPF